MKRIKKIFWVAAAAAVFGFASCNTETTDNSSSKPTVTENPSNTGTNGGTNTTDKPGTTTDKTETPSQFQYYYLACEDTGWGASTKTPDSNGQITISPNGKDDYKFKLLYKKPGSNDKWLGFGNMDYDDKSSGSISATYDGEDNVVLQGLRAIKYTLKFKIDGTTISYSVMAQ